MLFAVLLRALADLLARPIHVRANEVGDQFRQLGASLADYWRRDCALWPIGVPLAVALGLLAFTLEFIPYLGPIPAAVPGVLMAMSLGTTQALYALALYLGIQAVESYSQRHGAGAEAVP